MFCLAIYCFIIPNVQSPNLLILAQILAGMSTGIIFSFATSEAMKNVPVEKRSTAMGYYQAIYCCRNDSCADVFRYYLRKLWLRYGFLY